MLSLQNLTFFSILIWNALLSSTLAQITPDRTLNHPTQVEVDGETYRIREGTRSGNQLLHSFERFDIRADRTVVFENSLEIDNILTRVTGDRASILAGTLQAQGNANFFLINPNGILFRETARLEVGGAFLATTAESAVFDSGFAFSAKTPESPLLTVGVPVGLQWGNSSGSIRVEGVGTPTASIQTNRLTRNRPPQGLQVENGATLGLLGGNIEVVGGILEAPGGHLELGAVGQGRVGFSVDESRITTHYDGVTQFGDIQLSQQSLATTRGGGNAEINIQARNLGVFDGSLVLMQTWGKNSDRSFRIRVTEDIHLAGVSPDGRVFGGVQSDTWSHGRSADIEITATNLFVDNGARIQNFSAGQGAGGDLVFNVSDTVEVGDRFVPELQFATTIGTVTAGAAPGGHVIAEVGRLAVRNSAAFGAVTFGAGRAGDVSVRATERVELTERVPPLSSPTVIASLAWGDGDSGNLMLETPVLRILGGAVVSTTTLSAGNAGNLTVRVSDRLDIVGFDERLGGGIASASVPAVGDESSLLLNNLRFDLPPTSFGNAGNLSVSAPEIHLSNYGRLSVRSLGLGEAGNLSVNAETLTLETNASLRAETRGQMGGNLDLNLGQLRLDNARIDLSALGNGNGGNLNLLSGVLILDGSEIRVTSPEGNGGNILMNLTDRFVLQNSSQISTRSGLRLGGGGNGGNIDLEVPTVVLIDGSQIDAEAFAGRGGNVRIATRGLFASLDSQISAASRFGIDGTLIVNAPDFVEADWLTRNPEDERWEETVYDRCRPLYAGSEFVFRGRQASPPTPFDPSIPTALWRDWRPLRGNLPLENLDAPMGEMASTAPPREANYWRLGADGTVTLYAQHLVRPVLRRRSRCQLSER